MNPLSKSTCQFISLRMEQFKSIRRLVVKCAVGSPGVVEFNIIRYAFRKLPLRMVVPTIDLFPLHGGEEGLGHGIVMRTARLRKRLDNLVHAKQFPKGTGCILRALVAVEHQLPGLVSILVCLPKSGGDQIGTVLGRYPVGDYFSGKQVEDHADIEIETRFGASALNCRCNMFCFFASRSLF